MDEAGKLDLNAARPETLERLLGIVGASPPRAETLAAAVVAWRTPGPRPGVTGSGRRPFRFVEELLQVPGMGRELLYGRPRRQPDGRTVFQRGLMDFLTVYTATSRVNVNYAAPEVLAALPGMGWEEARSLVAARARRLLEASDLSRRAPAEALPFLTTQPSDTFSLVATAWLEGSATRRSLRVVARRDARARLGHQRLVWYDQYWPSPRVRSFSAPAPSSSAPARRDARVPAGTQRPTSTGPRPGEAFPPPPPRPPPPPPAARDAPGWDTSGWSGTTSTGPPPGSAAFPPPPPRRDPGTPAATTSTGLRPGSAPAPPPPPPPPAGLRAGPRKETHGPPEPRRNPQAALPGSGLRPRRPPPQPALLPLGAGAPGGRRDHRRLPGHAARPPPPPGAGLPGEEPGRPLQRGGVPAAPGGAAAATGAAPGGPGEPGQGGGVPTGPPAALRGAGGGHRHPGGAGGLRPPPAAGHPLRGAAVHPGPHPGLLPATGPFPRPHPAGGGGPGRLPEGQPAQGRGGSQPGGPTGPAPGGAGRAGAGPTEALQGIPL